MNSNTTTEKKPSGFRAWYGKNRDSIAAKRKANYAASAKVRQEVFDTKVAYESKEHLPVEVDGVLMYGSLAACQAIGITSMTLTNWFRKSYILDNRTEGVRSHSFTHAQVELMRELSAFIKGTSPNKPNFSGLLDEKIAYVKSNWHGNN